MKKEIPILFSTAMVQAILAGRKTMTRRVIDMDDLKENPDGFRSAGDSREWDVPRPAIKYDDRIWFAWELKNSNARTWIERCKYKPGDMLWVREEHYRFGYWVKNGTTKKGNQKWMFKAMTEDVRFAENVPNDINHPVRISRDKKTPGAATWYKRLARFMPKSACRIWLEVTDVRAERLQDISPEDACNEGVEYWNVDAEMLEGGELVADFKNYMWKDDESYEDYYFPTYANPVSSFFSLWESINGRESLDANPWVWVVSFKVLSNTGRPDTTYTPSLIASPGDGAVIVEGATEKELWEKRRQQIPGLYMPVSEETYSKIMSMSDEEWNEEVKKFPSCLTGIVKNPESSPLPASHIHLPSRGIVADGNDDEDENEFIPCDRCDGHDACADSGCAYKLGLGHMVNNDDIL